MKKLFFILVLAQFSYAQYFDCGMKAGLNLSTVYTKDSDSELDSLTYTSKLGFDLGAMAYHKFSDRSRLELDLMYSRQRGSRFWVDQDEKTYEELDQKISINYLMFSSMFKTRIIWFWDELTFDIGVQMGTPVYTRQITKRTTSPKLKNTSSLINAQYTLGRKIETTKKGKYKMHPFQCGAKIGLSYFLDQEVIFGLHYNLLLDVSTAPLQNSAANSLQISIAYIVE